MKFTLLSIFLFLLFLSAGVPAQKLQPQNDTTSGKYFLVSLTGYDEKYSFTYDKKGNMLTKAARIVGIDNTQTLFETCTYDDEGNLLMSIVHVSHVISGKYKYRTFYTYDKNGNKLSELRENWTDTGWVSSFRYSFTYDDKGNKLSELKEDWTDNSWVISSRSSYTYDKNGNKLSEINDEWTPIQLPYIIYDTVSSFKMIINNDGSEDTTGMIIFYTDNTGAGLELIKNVPYKVIQLSTRTTYSYDINGKIVSELHEKLEENAWLILSRKIYSYDIKGNKLSESEEHFSNEALIHGRRFIYSYDISGNIMSYREQYLQDTAWTEYERGTYTYDSNNNTLTGKSQETSSPSGLPTLTFTWNNKQDSLDIHSNYAIAEYIYIHGVKKKK